MRDGNRGNLVCKPAGTARLTRCACAMLCMGIAGCGTVVERQSVQLPWFDAPSTDSSDSVPPASSASPMRLSHWFNEVKQVTAASPPSHHRPWRPDLLVLPSAEIGSDRVYLRNIRDCDYRSEEDYDVRHFNRLVRLEDLNTVDFIVVPFKEAPALAHTMLSFGTRDGEQIVFSVEARLEQGEDYAAVAGAMNEFELMWVIGTERDLIRLRTEVRDVDVYLYPIRAEPQQVQKVFLAACGRVNEIARTPEYYDLLRNNCTTNIVDLVNDLSPGTVPKDLRVLLPGHSDRLAYDLGLLAAEGPFEQIKRASRINLAAQIHAEAPDFSQAIRREIGYRR